ncbi:hypothetical protein EMPS_07099 [Entomortierella parvispora]|uniref:Uncharacterized protein n=1 Tax=Entomortierella parvispora TaxID=205924 RepID=A0A9P3LXV2_9FUNG|nr:hypothetical protein EMPS_07099 [Entomortierella parvispora]
MDQSSNNGAMLPHAWTGDYDDGFPPTLLAQLKMCAASNAIREKPLWWQKFKDPVIAAKWEQEILDRDESRVKKTRNSTANEDNVQAQGMGLDSHEEDNSDGGDNVELSSQHEDDDEGADEEEGEDRVVAHHTKLKKEHLRFVFQELEWYADQRQQQVDQVDVPEHLKDWHPGSNKQVLDLVHPSLFPAVVGETRITTEPAIPALECIGKGTVLRSEDLPPVAESRRYEKFFSKKYQWLPTDFSVSSEGKVKIMSYINNLHPVEHADMYPVLEEIFEKFLPMFEEVLAEMQGLMNKPQRLNVDDGWYETPKDLINVPFRQQDRDYQTREKEWYRTRVPKPADIPDTFVAQPALEPYNLKTDNPLQVIVKLANIELTPENPIYSGGSWHVEGMMNENIVASGIYYYHSENVTDTRLNFRITVVEPDYEQGDARGCRIMYGLEDEEALSQPLDGIVTKQDRCIVFPNIYQHQVQPFELVDKTRPGTRQILVFFLVNPECKVLSTTNVPPLGRVCGFDG